MLEISLLKGELVSLHRPLIADLVLCGLLVPVGSLLLGKGLEMPRDDLGNLSKLGLWVGNLDIIPRGIGVQEETRLVALGRIGVLLLLFLGLLLLAAGCVAVGIGIVGFGGRLVVLHLRLVTLLVFGGELIPAAPIGGGDCLEFAGEELGNITKLGFRVLLLYSASIRVGIQEERTHVALGTVGILVLLLLTAPLGLHDHFLLFLLDTIDVFFVGAHGNGGDRGE